jgi:hypothetical protein
MREKKMLCFAVSGVCRISECAQRQGYNSRLHHYSDNQSVLLTKRIVSLLKIDANLENMTKKQADEQRTTLSTVFVRGDV